MRTASHVADLSHEVTASIYGGDVNSHIRHSEASRVGPWGETVGMEAVTLVACAAFSYLRTRIEDGSTPRWTSHIVARSASAIIPEALQVTGGH